MVVKEEVCNYDLVNFFVSGEDIKSKLEIEIEKLVVVVKVKKDRINNNNEVVSNMKNLM